MIRFIGPLIVVIQVYFVYHAIRSGRDKWVYLIVLVPGVGSLAYFFVEYLPEMRGHPKVRKVTKEIMKTVDPTRDLRNLREQVEINGSVRNKQDLAEEMIDHGLCSEAVEILEPLLEGMFEHDPQILLPLARAYFILERYADALAALDRLKEHNPDFESQEGHLLYARSQEGLGLSEDALTTYESLVAYAAGAEARCRYALLLNKTGYVEKAQEQFGAILHRAKISSDYYRKEQKRWIAIAEQNRA